jgi:lysozyme
MSKILIKKFEGLRLVAYLCSKNVVTIGWGSTRYSDKTRVKIQDTITVEQAEDMLDYHLINNTYPFVEMLFKKFTKNANKYFGSEDLANRIFAATSSLVYNVGSTGPIFLDALKSANLQKISDAFLLYNKIKVKGEFVESTGLTNRRKKEIEFIKEAK